jgi:hypothetical protein
MVERIIPRSARTKDGRIRKRGKNGGILGRPPAVEGGKRNRLTDKVVRQALHKGEKLPHELYIDTINAFWKGEKLYGKYRVTLEDAKWAADRGARYYQPMLVNVDRKGEVPKPTNVFYIPPEVVAKLDPDQAKVLLKVIDMMDGRVMDGELITPKGNPQAYAEAIGFEG